MTMGEIIRKLRIENNMTQEELGLKIGVQKSAIRKYESGLVENIPRSSIKKMAEIFGVKPSYLMGWEDENNKSPPTEKEELHDIINIAELSETKQALVKLAWSVPEHQADLLLRVMKSILEDGG